jgi:hypothetical protein
MSSFAITVRTDYDLIQYIAIAASAADAFEAAATQFADVPCGITVIGQVHA